MQSNTIYAAYIGEVLNTIEVGQSLQKQSKIARNPNILQGQVYSTTVSIDNNLTFDGSNALYGYPATLANRYVVLE